MLWAKPRFAAALLTALGGVRVQRGVQGGYLIRRLRGERAGVKRETSRKEIGYGYEMNRKTILAVFVGCGDGVAREVKSGVWQYKFLCETSYK